VSYTRPTRTDICKFLAKKVDFSTAVGRIQFSKLRRMTKREKKTGEILLS
jgi:hypothetical protein